MTRKRTRSRRLFAGLLVSLVLLLALFRRALAYLRPAAEGRELTLDLEAILALVRPEVTLFGGLVPERA